MDAIEHDDAPLNLPPPREVADRCMARAWDDETPDRDYYTVDPHTRFPDRRHCDLEQLAREYRVLRPEEVIGE